MRFLNIRFYIDPVTGRPHIENHQVGTDEARRWWRNPAKIARVSTEAGSDGDGQLF